MTRTQVDYNEKYVYNGKKKEQIKWNVILGGTALLGAFQKRIQFSPPAIIRRNGINIAFTLNIDSIILFLLSYLLTYLFFFTYVL
jgi:hypothetical protein